MLPPIFKAKHGFGMINIEQEITNADEDGNQENSGEASMTEQSVVNTLNIPGVP